MPLQSTVASTAHGVGGRTLTDRLPAQSTPLLANAFAGARNAQRADQPSFIQVPRMWGQAPTDPETADGPPGKRARPSGRSATSVVIAAARAWRALREREKWATTMEAFAKDHQCAGVSMRRYVTYEGDYKEPMRPFLTSDEILSATFAKAPSKRLKDVLSEFRLQHPGSDAPEDFVAFAKTKGVRSFRGVKRMLQLDGKSIKDAAVPGAAAQGNLARPTEHDGRVIGSKSRAAAEAWHKLAPAVRLKTDPAAFAGHFGTSRAGMQCYVEFDGTYKQRMLELLAAEDGAGPATPTEEPATPPQVAGSTDSQDPRTGEELDFSEWTPADMAALGSALVELGINWTGASADAP